MSYKAITYRGRVYVICQSRIYCDASGGFGGGWTVVHRIFDDGAERNLSLAITIGSDCLTVVGAGRDIWSRDGITWHDENNIQNCKCQLKVLMLTGCQCGGT